MYGTKKGLKKSIELTFNNTLELHNLTIEPKGVSYDKHIGITDVFVLLHDKTCID